MYWQNEKELRETIKLSPDFEPNEAFVETARNAGLDVIRKQANKRQKIMVLNQVAVVAAALLLIWGVISQHGPAKELKTEMAASVQVDESGPQKTAIHLPESSKEYATAATPPQQIPPAQEQDRQNPQAAAMQITTVETERATVDKTSTPTEETATPNIQTSVEAEGNVREQIQKKGTWLAEQDILSPAMQKSWVDLQNSFPILKEVNGIESDDDDDNQEAASIRASLLKTAPDGQVHTVAKVEFNEQGEVNFLQLPEKENGSHPDIPTETAKVRAKEYLEKILGVDASAFSIVSVWTEKSYDLQMNGTIRKYTVNFKKPVPGDPESAFYATLLVDSGGEFLSFEKVKKPISYDSWYAVDFERRAMPEKNGNNE